MPTDENTQGAGNPTMTETPQTPPAPTNAPAAPDPDAELGVRATGKNSIVPQDAWKRMKEKQREQGRKQAHKELEQQAQHLGFSSVTEMLAAAAASRKTAAATPPARTQATTDDEESDPPQQERRNDRPRNGHHRPNQDRSQQRFEAERQKLAQQLEVERRARVKAEKLARLRAKELEAKETEASLREAARDSGVKDVDYAVSLLRREVEGKSTEELKDFDEKKFFSKLLEDRPYLGGEVIRPATTGTGVGTQPRPAGVPPQPPNANGANGASIDARKLNPQEFAELLRKRGLTLGGGLGG